METVKLETIIMQAQKGEEAAFTYLMDTYGKLVFYIAIQKVGNEADAMDIVQETFLEVRRSIAQLKEPKYFKSWLNKIALSKISRHYERRKDRTMNATEIQELQKIPEYRSYMSPQRTQRFQSDRELLDQCLAQLKPIYAQVLVLQYLEGYTLQEIAAMLKIPEGTVKSRANVAKRELRQIVERFEEQEQLKIDFHALGLESLSTALFVKESLQPSAQKPQGTKQAKRIFQQFHAHPFLAPILTTTLAMSTVFGATKAYQHFSQPQSIPNDPVKMIVKEDMARMDPFPEIYYQGHLITNAKEAYQIIYTSTMDFSQDVLPMEIEDLNQQLQMYGGEYAKMADHLLDYYYDK